MDKPTTDQLREASRHIEDAHRIHGRSEEWALIGLKRALAVLSPSSPAPVEHSALFALEAIDRILAKHDGDTGEETLGVGKDIEVGSTAFRSLRTWAREGLKAVKAEQLGPVIRYQNEASGMWYTNRFAAGDIDVIEIDGLTYQLGPVEQKEERIDHTHPDWGDSSHMTLEVLTDPSKWPGTADEALIRAEQDAYEALLEANTSYPVSERLNMVAAYGAGMRKVLSSAPSTVPGEQGGYKVVRVSKATDKDPDDHCWGIEGPVQVGTVWYKNNEADCRGYCDFLNRVAAPHTPEGLTVEELRSVVSKALRFHFNENEQDWPFIIDDVVERLTALYAEGRERVRDRSEKPAAEGEDL